MMKSRLLLKKISRRSALLKHKGRAVKDGSNIVLYSAAFRAGLLYLYPFIEVIIVANFFIRLKPSFRAQFAAAFYYDKTDDVAVQGVYSGIVDAFKMYGLGFRVKMMGAPTLLWDFSSLKIALETLYGFYLTDPDRPLRICKHCGKVFVSRKSTAEFCSVPCRNQYNVYKSRGKK